MKDHSLPSTSGKGIATYIALAFAFGVALSLIVGVTGGYRSPFIGLRFFSMFIPAVAVLGVRSLTRTAVDIEWHRVSWTYVPVALLLLPFVLHAAMVPVTVAYEGRLPWQGWLTPQPDGLLHSPTERNWGVMTPTALAGRIALNAGVGVVVVSVLALFEEIGWRGWLLPRLQLRLGARVAVVITSAIWAVWHIPFQLSGVQHVDGVSPAMLALTVPFGIFAAGLVIGWLWLQTESIWIVALAHGALNNWGQYAFKYMRFVQAPDLAVASAGSLAVLVLGVLLIKFGVTPSQRFNSP
jgi:membrane protease YdiL (CAAX protease family)